MSTVARMLGIKPGDPLGEWSEEQLRREAERAMREIARQGFQQPGLGPLQGMQQGALGGLLNKNALIMPPGFYLHPSTDRIVRAETGRWVDHLAISQASPAERSRIFAELATPEPEPFTPPFTKHELETGRATELREVNTPKPGSTVEVGYLVTELVLVCNRLVLEVQELKAELERVRQAPVIKEEPFQLPKVGEEYD